MTKGQNTAATSPTFNELMKKALTECRQRVDSAHGAVFVISEQELQRIEQKTGKRDFVDFLLSAPNMEGLDLTRDKRPLRDIEW